MPDITKITQNKIKKRPATTRKRGNNKPSSEYYENHISGLMYFKYGFIVIIIIGTILFLCYKILELKNDYGNEYERKAIMQLLNSGSNLGEVIKPNRGAILDRNKQTLAYSTIVYNFFVDIRLLSKRDEEKIEDTFEKVNRILGIPMETLYDLIKTDENDNLIRDTNYHVIARQIPHNIASQLIKETPWDVYPEEDTKRFYTNGTVAPQVIGFVRGDVPWGLENSYNKELTGIQGRIFRSYDTEGKSVVTERVDAEEGLTLVTTLDLGIQQAAERTVQKYYDMYNPDYTMIIVMNPQTGEVLAMATSPGFNVNDPLNLDYLSDRNLAQEWSYLEQTELIDNLYSIWKNTAITATYEPGSTFKPITIAAALEEGIISENTTFHCPGHKVVAGITIGCARRSGHGTINLREALAYSCNVALMEIAEKMGREIFYKYQKDFGYGEETGIDLPGEESAANLQHSLSGLNVVELATASFGQRFNCTPLQAITGFCALINGGYLYKPYLVAQTVNHKGNVVSETKPEVIRRVISKETSDFLRNALVDTTIYGTGTRAYIEGLSIGGKTGTAEQGLKESPNYHEASSFIGYFPAEDPQYVVLALIYNPEGDTPSAAPMFKELVLDIRNLKTIPFNQGELSSGTIGTIETEDYRGRPVWEVIQSLNRLGIDFDLVGGRGTVIEAQFPNPGEKITKDSTVYLTVAESEEYPDDIADLPDVIGLTVTEAKRVIIESGFIPVVVYDNTENTNENTNVVYKQMPDSITSITRGSEIKIKVR